jgi:hypothetical protein
MNRLTKTLALAAVVLAGAFGATAAQASAANFTVDFKVQNNDTSSISMIRVTTSLPTTVTGLINPASAISAGNADPSSGNAQWSDALPALGHSTSVSLVYGRASDQGAQCTFTMTVSHDSNLLPYLLSFTASPNPPCTAPASVRSSNGVYTNQIYALGWANY